MDKIKNEYCEKILGNTYATKYICGIYYKFINKETGAVLFKGMRYKCMGIHKKRGTFGLYIYDTLKDRMTSPVIQFSLVDPWWIPKFKKDYFKRYGDNGSGWLAGWLFVYIGVCITNRK